MRRIGIDVGGTNTDAVLLEGDRIVATAKTPTTPEVTTGIVRVLELLTAEPRAAARTVDAVMIGTTHFTNAVVQRRDLAPVAAHVDLLRLRRWVLRRPEHPGGRHGREDPLPRRPESRDGDPRIRPARV